MDKRVKNNIILGSLIAIVIIGLTGLSYFINGYLNLSDVLNTERLGHFGDFVGGFLGTLLTILATVLIYLTYSSQKQELKLTRNLLEQQSFENTFFNMLKVHQDLKNSISFNSQNLLFRRYVITGTNGQHTAKPIDIEGKKIFNIAMDDFKRLYYYPSANDKSFQIYDFIVKEHDDKKYDDLGYKPNHLKEHIEHTTFKYELFFRQYGKFIGEYFRNLYHLLNFISKKKLNEISQTYIPEERKLISNKYRQYADIVQSQMSLSELFLVYYNSFQFRKLRKLVNEFDFLENMNASNLMDEYHLKLNCFGKIKTD